MVADLAPGIEAKRQHVTIDVPPDVGSFAADPAKLHDIVRNLVENAVNYSPEESDIRLQAVRQDGAFVLTVSRLWPWDSSRGSDARLRAFLPSGQIAITPGGTGLGLAIVRHLTELHGGTATAGIRAREARSSRIALPG